MDLIFQGGNEIVKLIIDRDNKKLKVVTSNTNYKVVETPWKFLFDKGKEDFQEKITDKLGDKEFRLAIVASMAQIGYVLKK